ncbi:MAG: hypothetical protein EOP84_27615 [Verrucomicrobiaceae bacterium]|nr:MAG: hypothetical protein EOP84_27615 [Verrucomicrobiaceae bacterium]
MKETDSYDRTPEELLQILDMGIELQRARRKGAQKSRALFLTLGVFFILTGAAVALLVLSHLVNESRSSMHGQPVAVQE